MGCGHCPDIAKWLLELQETNDCPKSWLNFKQTTLRYWKCCEAENSGKCESLFQCGPTTQNNFFPKNCIYSKMAFWEWDKFYNGAQWQDPLIHIFFVLWQMCLFSPSCSDRFQSFRGKVFFRSKPFIWLCNPPTSAREVMSCTSTKKTTQRISQRKWKGHAQIWAARCERGKETGHQVSLPYIYLFGRDVALWPS